MRTSRVRSRSSWSVWSLADSPSEAGLDAKHAAPAVPLDPRAQRACCVDRIQRGCGRRRCRGEAASCGRGLHHHRACFPWTEASRRRMAFGPAIGAVRHRGKRRGNRWRSSPSGVHEPRAPRGQFLRGSCATGLESEACPDPPGQPWRSAPFSTGGPRPKRIRPHPSNRRKPRRKRGKRRFASSSTRSRGPSTTKMIYL